MADLLLTNFALLDPRNWWLLRNPLRPSWGEPYRDIAHRMHAALNDAAFGAGEGGAAVLVSHQSPIWITHRHLAGQPLWHDPRRRRCALSSITTFEPRGDAFVEVGYAEPAAGLGETVDVGAV